MSRHRNHRHELFAQALAADKLRPEAMITAGYKPHRGNQNRMAQLPDVIARVKEIQRYVDQIVDLREIDRGRLRIACADARLRRRLRRPAPRRWAVRFRRFCSSTSGLMACSPSVSR
jgi:phage terminase small subunit